MCCCCLQHASNSVTVHKLVWLTESKVFFLLRCITGRKQKALECSKPFVKQSFLNENTSFQEERAHVIFRQTDADQYSAHKSVSRKCNHKKKMFPFCFQIARSLSDCVHNSSKKRPSDSAVSIEKQRNYCLESHTAVGIFCETLLKTAEIGGHYVMPPGRTTVLI